MLTAMSAVRLSLAMSNTRNLYVILATDLLVKELRVVEIDQRRFTSSITSLSIEQYIFLNVIFTILFFIKVKNERIPVSNIKHFFMNNLFQLDFCKPLDIFRKRIRL